MKWKHQRWGNDLAPNYWFIQPCLHNRCISNGKTFSFAQCRTLHNSFISNRLTLHSRTWLEIVSKIFVGTHEKSKKFEARKCQIRFVYFFSFRSFSSFFLHFFFFFLCWEVSEKERERERGERERERGSSSSSRLSWLSMAASPCPSLLVRRSKKRRESH